MTSVAVDVQSELLEVRILLEQALGRCNRLIAPSNDSGETLDTWAERWLATRRTSRPMDELARYRAWIAPQLGCRPVSCISRAEIEEWVAAIDQQVIGGSIMASTASRIWSILSTMFRDAYSSKVVALRVRADDPTDSVRPPDSAAPRASTFLYPDEFLQLARCTAIPVSWRRLYTLAVYLYPRAGEIRALRWADIDLQSGRIHIHRSEDRRGEIGRTKTETDRQFVCEPALLPLLRAMQRESGRGKVLPYIPQAANLARELRKHLQSSNCWRDDLHADDAGRRPLTFHDLRATGITWQAMRGDAPTDIMERVGHSQITTTQRYMRRGRLLVAKRERVFPTLPNCLL